KDLRRMIGGGRLLRRKEWLDDGAQQGRELAKENVDHLFIVQTANAIGAVAQPIGVERRRPPVAFIIAKAIGMVELVGMDIKGGDGGNAEGDQSCRCNEKAAK